MLQIPFWREKTRGEIVKKSFTPKNPGPLIRFVTDLLGGRDTAQVSNAIEQSIWVYRAVTILGRVGQVPLLVKDRKDDVVKAGSVRFLFDSPNSMQSGPDFMERLSMILGYCGNAYVLLNDGNGSGTLPTYYTLVNPAHMSYDNERDYDPATQTVTRWRRKLTWGREQVIEAKQVIHIALPNPNHPIIGLSPMTALRVTVDAEYAARVHNQFQMQKHGRVSGVVSFDDQIGDTNLKLLKKMWDDQYAGAENAGETAFLDMGGKYQQMALSAKDMDWMSGQQISREEICAAFGIPPNIAGILDKATYSNYEQASLSLWTETLIPLGNKICSAFNRTLTSTGQHICFDWSSIQAIQQDESVRVDRYVKLVNAKVTPERAAQIAGIDLGEILPEHKVIWLGLSEVASTMQAQGEDDPSQIQEALNGIQITSILDVLARVSAGTITDQAAAALLSQAFPAMTPAAIASMVAGAIPTPTTAPDQEPQKSIETPQEDFRQKMKTALANGAVKDATAYEKKMEDALKKFFYAQRSSVLSRVEKVFDSVKSVNKNFAYTPAELAIALLSEKDWNAELLKFLTPIIYELSDVAAARWIREAGLQTTQIDAALMQNFFKQQGVLIRKVNETTYDALLHASRTIVAGAVEGANISVLMDQLKTDLRSVFNNTESRRRTIARTETLRTVNGTRFEQMKAAGMEFKQWLTVGDDDVREQHTELNGKIVRMGEPFYIPDSTDGIMYPLDPGAPASETINCRCTIIALSAEEVNQ